MQIPETLLVLIEKYLAGTASQAEKQELHDWYHSTHKEVVTVLTGEEDAEEKTEARLRERLRMTIGNMQAPVKKMFPRKQAWAAAAAILVLLVSGYWLFFERKKTQQPEQVTIAVTDIKAPDKSKAMITLADGSQVALDSLASGTLATQGNVQVIKNTDGEIIYTGSSDEVAWNTLYNPRGSKVVNLTLSDGSKVWLNSESSLKFPVAFTGNERKVEITGEGYFEVAKNRSMPFSVTVKDLQVEVLGTHFNINSYEDETAIKTTLLEGSVRVLNAQSAVIIKPGQQASAKVSEGDIKIREADVDEVVAWKNGRFQFQNADLESVLRQLARWYDVDVVYEGKIPKRNFEGEIQRTMNLSGVLKLLEKNKVNFRIDGKKIIVSP